MTYFRAIIVRTLYKGVEEVDSSKIDQVGGIEIFIARKGGGEDSMGDCSWNGGGGGFITSELSSHLLKLKC